MLTGHSGEGDCDRTRKLEGSEQDLWAHTLARIPTTLGRLVYLAARRDESTGRYRDHELARACSDTETDLLLRKIHEEVFGTWLSFSLTDQREELERYLKSVKKEEPSELGTWLTSAPYLKLIPASAEAAEKELYGSDLEIVLELLKK